MALPQINSSTSADIPVVKLSSPSAAVDLLNAAATYGFVFVENEEQDIPTVDVKDMFDLVLSTQTDDHSHSHTV